jgi:hypothetical protein
MRFHAQTCPHAGKTPKDAGFIPIWLFLDEFAIYSKPEPFTPAGNPLSGVAGTCAVV